MPRAAVRATALELLQTEDKGTMIGVLQKNLTLKEMKKIILSSLFLKMKYDSSGMFDKLYDVTETNYISHCEPLFRVYGSSYTATAGIEGRSVATMDVGGAFLNAGMKRTFCAASDRNMKNI